MLFDELFDEAERVRWRMSEIPWDAIETDKVTPELIAFVREVVTSELTTFTASRRFLHEFASDVDFTQWVSIWFYEETKHPQVLQRWLRRLGETFDDDALLRGRAATPFMRSLTGTLVTNVISEVVASSGYARLAATSPEPVLARIAKLLASDEARHATSFFAYAKRAVETSREPNEERIAALKVLHAWLAQRESVGHPVNRFHERSGGIDLAEDAAVRRRVCRLIGELVGRELTGVEDTMEVLRALATARGVAS